MKGQRKKKKSKQQITKKVAPKPQIQKQESKEEESSTSISSDSSSEQVIVPAIKEMKFRNKRGERINQLIKKDEEFQNKDDEDFWKNNKYFGNGATDDDLDDNESFKVDQNEVASKDSYDSDFGEDEDGLNKDDNEKSQEQEEVDDEEKEKKQSHLNPIKKYRKVNFHKSLDDLAQNPEIKTSNIEEVEQDKDTISQASQELDEKKYYIHEYFTQEELLREAVQTEKKNIESLNDLIFIEEQKRRIHIHNKKNIEGPYTQTIVRQNKQETDKDNENNPQFQIQTVVKFKNWDKRGNHPLDFFAYIKDIPESSSSKPRRKYRDSITGEYFDNFEGFQKLRKNYKGSQSVKISKQIEKLTNIIQKFSDD